MKFKIGIVSSVEVINSTFDRSDLVLVAGGMTKPRWWRSPLSSLNIEGFKRLGGISVVWGSRDYILESLKSLPDPAIIAVSNDSLGGDESEFIRQSLDRVTWIEINNVGRAAITILADCKVAGVEINVFDHMEM